MLVRALRLTDKLGNALLRFAIFLGEQLLIQLYRIRVGLIDVLSALIFAFRQGRIVYESNAERRRAIMARRAAELSTRTVVREDPLKTQNRALSIFTMLLMIGLIGLVWWFTGSGQGSRASGIATVPGALLLPTNPPPTATPTVNATATLSSNPLTEGSVTFALHQNGYDNLWGFTFGRGNPVRLTNTAADDRYPAFSPDGKRIAFASNRDGNWELYILELATLQSRRLTFSPAYKGAPSWSPDGQFLAYETYENDNLDVYIIAVDGSSPPQPLTRNPAPDFEPTWAPGAGRQIAYVSLRDGNPEIYVLDLNQVNEPLALRLTNTVAEEANPRWSPDGRYIAYDARENGVDLVYVKAAQSPQDVALVIGQGVEPAWAPDSRNLLYLARQGGQTVLSGGQVGNSGVFAVAQSLPGKAHAPDWTKASLPEPVLIRGVADPNLPPLYTENTEGTAAEPPYYKFRQIGATVSSRLNVLSDRVDDSFNALREAANRKVGYDFLGSLRDALWDGGRLPDAGQPRQNWHYTGRAFSFDGNLVFNEPPPIEVVREDIGVATYWRVYVRVAPSLQNGTRGEPLKRFPWDFAARTDPIGLENGGRLKAIVPAGYYVDFTELAEDYGWFRVASERLWRSNFSSIQYWQYEKRDNLTWEQAMLEIMSRDELQQVLTGPTLVPTPRVQPTDTPPPRRSPTPIPPP